MSGSPKKKDKYNRDESVAGNVLLRTAEQSEQRRRADDRRQQHNASMSQSASPIQTPRLLSPRRTPNPEGADGGERHTAIPTPSAPSTPTQPPTDESHPVKAGGGDDAASNKNTINAKGSGGGAEEGHASKGGIHNGAGTVAGDESDGGYSNEDCYDDDEFVDNAEADGGDAKSDADTSPFHGDNEDDAAFRDEHHHYTNMNDMSSGSAMLASPAASGLRLALKVLGDKRNPHKDLTALQLDVSDIQSFAHALMTFSKVQSVDLTMARIPPSAGKMLVTAFQTNRTPITEVYLEGSTLTPATQERLRAVCDANVHRERVRRERDEKREHDQRERGIMEVLAKGSEDLIAFFRKSLDRLRQEEHKEWRALMVSMADGRAATVRRIGRRRQATRFAQLSTLLMERETVLRAGIVSEGLVSGVAELTAAKCEMYARLLLDEARVTDKHLWERYGASYRFAATETSAIATGKQLQALDVFASFSMHRAVIVSEQLMARKVIEEASIESWLSVRQAQVEAKQREDDERRRQRMAKKDAEAAAERRGGTMGYYGEDESYGRGGRRGSKTNLMAGGMSSAGGVLKDALAPEALAVLAEHERQEADARKLLMNVEQIIFKAIIPIKKHYNRLTHARRRVDELAKLYWDYIREPARCRASVGTRAPPYVCYENITPFTPLEPEVTLSITMGSMWPVKMQMARVDLEKRIPIFRQAQQQCIPSLLALFTQVLRDYKGVGITDIAWVSLLKGEVRDAPNYVATEEALAVTLQQIQSPKERIFIGEIYYRIPEGSPLRELGTLEFVEVSEEEAATRRQQVVTEMLAANAAAASAQQHDVNLSSTLRSNSSSPAGGNSLSSTMRGRSLSPGRSAANSPATPINPLELTPLQQKQVARYTALPKRFFTISFNDDRTELTMAVPTGATTDEIESHMHQIRFVPFWAKRLRPALTMGFGVSAATFRKSNNANTASPSPPMPNGAASRRATVVGVPTGPEGGDSPNVVGRRRASIAPGEAGGSGLRRGTSVSSLQRRSSSLFVTNERRNTPLISQPMLVSIDVEVKLFMVKQRRIGVSVFGDATTADKAASPAASPRGNKGQHGQGHANGNASSDAQKKGVDVVHSALGDSSLARMSSVISGTANTRGLGLVSLMTAAAGGDVTTIDTSAAAQIAHQLNGGKASDEDGAPLSSAKGRGGAYMAPVTTTPPPQGPPRRRMRLPSCQLSRCEFRFSFVLAPQIFTFVDRPLSINYEDISGARGGTRRGSADSGDSFSITESTSEFGSILEDSHGPGGGDGMAGGPPSSPLTNSLLCSRHDARKGPKALLPPNAVSIFEPPAVSRNNLNIFFSGVPQLSTSMSFRSGTPMHGGISAVGTPANGSATVPSRLGGGGGGFVATIVAAARASSASKSPPRPPTTDPLNATVGHGAMGMNNNKSAPGVVGSIGVGADGVALDPTLRVPGGIFPARPDRTKTDGKTSPTNSPRGGDGAASLPPRPNTRGMSPPTKAADHPSRPPTNAVGGAAVTPPFLLPIKSIFRGLVITARLTQRSPLVFEDTLLLRDLRPNQSAASVAQTAGPDGKKGVPPPGTVVITSDEILIYPFPGPNQSVDGSTRAESEGDAMSNAAGSDVEDDEDEKNLAATSNSDARTGTPNTKGGSVPPSRSGGRISGLVSTPPRTSTPTTAGAAGRVRRLSTATRPSGLAGKASPVASRTASKAKQSPAQPTGDDAKPLASIVAKSDGKKTTSSASSNGGKRRRNGEAQPYGPVVVSKYSILDGQLLLRFADSDCVCGEAIDIVLGLICYTNRSIDPTYGKRFIDFEARNDRLGIDARCRVIVDVYASDDPTTIRNHFPRLVTRPLLQLAPPPPALNAIGDASGTTGQTAAAVGKLEMDAARREALRSAENARAHAEMLNQLATVLTHPEPRAVFTGVELVDDDTTFFNGGYLTFSLRHANNSVKGKAAAAEEKARREKERAAKKAAAGGATPSSRHHHGGSSVSATPRATLGVTPISTNLSSSTNGTVGGGGNSSIPTAHHHKERGPLVDVAREGMGMYMALPMRTLDEVTRGDASLRCGLCLVDVSAAVPPPSSSCAKGVADPFGSATPCEKNNNHGNHHGAPPPRPPPAAVSAASATSPSAAVDPAVLKVQRRHSQVQMASATAAAVTVAALRRSISEGHPNAPVPETTAAPPATEAEGAHAIDRMHSSVNEVSADLTAAAVTRSALRKSHPDAAANALSDAESPTRDDKKSVVVVDTTPVAVPIPPITDASRHSQQQRAHQPATPQFLTIFEDGFPLGTVEYHYGGAEGGSSSASSTAGSSPIASSITIRFAEHCTATLDAVQELLRAVRYVDTDILRCADASHGTSDCDGNGGRDASALVATLEFLVGPTAGRLDVEGREVPSEAADAPLFATVRIEREAQPLAKYVLPTDATEENYDPSAPLYFLQSSHDPITIFDKDSIGSVLSVPDAHRLHGGYIRIEIIDGLDDGDQLMLLPPPAPMVAAPAVVANTSVNGPFTPSAAPASIRVRKSSVISSAVDGTLLLNVQSDATGTTSSTTPPPPPFSGALGSSTMSQSSNQFHFGHAPPSPSAGSGAHTAQSSSPIHGTALAGGGSANSQSNSVAYFNTTAAFGNAVVASGEAFGHSDDGAKGSPDDNGANKPPSREEEQAMAVRNAVLAALPSTPYSTLANTLSPQGVLASIAAAHAQYVAANAPTPSSAAGSKRSGGPSAAALGAKRGTIAAGLLGDASPGRLGSGGGDGGMSPIGPNGAPTTPMRLRAMSASGRSASPYDARGDSPVGGGSRGATPVGMRTESPFGGHEPVNAVGGNAGAEDEGNSSTTYNAAAAAGAGGPARTVVPTLIPGGTYVTPSYRRPVTVMALQHYVVPTASAALDKRASQQQQQPVGIDLALGAPHHAVAEEHQPNGGQLLTSAADDPFELAMLHQQAQQQQLVGVGGATKHPAVFARAIAASQAFGLLEQQQHQQMQQAAAAAVVGGATPLPSSAAMAQQRRSSVSNAGAAGALSPLRSGTVGLASPSPLGAEVSGSGLGPRRRSMSYDTTGSTTGTAVSSAAATAVLGPSAVPASCPPLLSPVAGAAPLPSYPPRHAETLRGIVDPTYFFNKYLNFMNVFEKREQQQEQLYAAAAGGGGVGGNSNATSPRAAANSNPLNASLTGPPPMLDDLHRASTPSTATTAAGPRGALSMARQRAYTATGGGDGGPLPSARRGTTAIHVGGGGLDAAPSPGGGKGHADDAAAAAHHGSDGDNLSADHGVAAVSSKKKDDEVVAMGPSLFHNILLACSSSRPSRKEQYPHEMALLEEDGDCGGSDGASEVGGDGEGGDDAVADAAVMKTPAPQHVDPTAAAGGGDLVGNTSANAMITVSEATQLQWTMRARKIHIHRSGGEEDPNAVDDSDDDDDDGCDDSEEEDVANASTNTRDPLNLPGTTRANSIPIGSINFGASGGPSDSGNAAAHVSSAEGSGLPHVDSAATSGGNGASQHLPAAGRTVSFGKGIVGGGPTSAHSSSLQHTNSISLLGAGKGLGSRRSTRNMPPRNSHGPSVVLDNGAVVHVPIATHVDLMMKASKALAADHKGRLAQYGLCTERPPSALLEGESASAIPFTEPSEDFCEFVASTHDVWTVPSRPVLVVDTPAAPSAGPAPALQSGVASAAAVGSGVVSPPRPSTRPATAQQQHGVSLMGSRPPSSAAHAEARQRRAHQQQLLEEEEEAERQRKQEQHAAPSDGAAVAVPTAFLLPPQPVYAATVFTLTGAIPFDANAYYTHRGNTVLKAIHDDEIGHYATLEQQRREAAAAAAAMSTQRRRASNAAGLLGLGTGAFDSSVRRGTTLAAANSANANASFASVNTANTASQGTVVASPLLSGGSAERPSVGFNLPTLSTSQQDYNDESTTTAPDAILYNNPLLSTNLVATTYSSYDIAFPTTAVDGRVRQDEPLWLERCRRVAHRQTKDARNVAGIVIAFNKHASPTTNGSAAAVPTEALVHELLSRVAFFSTGDSPSLNKKMIKITLCGGRGGDAGEEEEAAAGHGADGNGRGGSAPPTAPRHDLGGQTVLFRSLQVLPRPKLPEVTTAVPALTYRQEATEMAIEVPWSKEREHALRLHQQQQQQALLAQQAAHHSGGAAAKKSRKQSAIFGESNNLAISRNNSNLESALESAREKEKDSGVTPLMGHAAARDRGGSASPQHLLLGGATLLGSAHHASSMISNASSNGGAALIPPPSASSPSFINALNQQAIGSGAAPLAVPDKLPEPALGNVPYPPLGAVTRLFSEDALYINDHCGIGGGEADDDLSVLGNGISADGDGDAINSVGSCWNGGRIVLVGRTTADLFNIVVAPPLSASATYAELTGKATRRKSNSNGNGVGIGMMSGFGAMEASQSPRGAASGGSGGAVPNTTMTTNGLQRQFTLSGTLGGTLRQGSLNGTVSGGGGGSAQPQHAAGAGASSANPFAVPASPPPPPHAVVPATAVLNDRPITVRDQVVMLSVEQQQLADARRAQLLVQRIAAAQKAIDLRIAQERADAIAAKLPRGIGGKGGRNRTARGNATTTSVPLDATTSPRLQAAGAGNATARGSSPLGRSGIMNGARRTSASLFGASDGGGGGAPSSVPNTMPCLPLDMQSILMLAQQGNASLVGSGSGGSYTAAFGGGGGGATTTRNSSVFTPMSPLGSNWFMRDRRESASTVAGMTPCALDTPMAHGGGVSPCHAEAAAAHAYALQHQRYLDALQSALVAMQRHPIYSHMSAQSRELVTLMVAASNAAVLERFSNAAANNASSSSNPTATPGNVAADNSAAAAASSSAASGAKGAAIPKGGGTTLTIPSAREVSKDKALLAASRRRSSMHKSLALANAAAASLQQQQQQDEALVSSVGKCWWLRHDELPPSTEDQQTPHSQRYPSNAASNPYAPNAGAGVAPPYSALPYTTATSSTLTHTQQLSRMLLLSAFSSRPNNLASLVAGDGAGGGGGGPSSSASSSSSPPIPDEWLVSSNVLPVALLVATQLLKAMRGVNMAYRYSLGGGMTLAGMVGGGVPSSSSSPLMGGGGGSIPSLSTTQQHPIQAAFAAQHLLMNNTNNSSSSTGAIAAAASPSARGDVPPPSALAELFGGKDDSLVTAYEEQLSLCQQIAMKELSAHGNVYFVCDPPLQQSATSPLLPYTPLAPNAATTASPSASAVNNNLSAVQNLNAFNPCREHVVYGESNTNNTASSGGGGGTRGGGGGGLVAPDLATAMGGPSMAFGGHHHSNTMHAGASAPKKPSSGGGLGGAVGGEIQLAATFGGFAASPALDDTAANPMSPEGALGGGEILDHEPHANLTAETAAALSPYTTTHVVSAVDGSGAVLCEHFAVITLVRMPWTAMPSLVSAAYALGSAPPAADGSGGGNIAVNGVTVLGVGNTNTNTTTSSGSSPTFNGTVGSFAGGFGSFLGAPPFGGGGSSGGGSSRRSISPSAAAAAGGSEGVPPAAPGLNGAAATTTAAGGSRRVGGANGNGGGEKAPAVPAFAGGVQPSMPLGVLSLTIDLMPPTMPFGPSNGTPAASGRIRRITTGLLRRFIGTLGFTTSDPLNRLLLHAAAAEEASAQATSLAQTLLNRQRAAGGASATSSRVAAAVAQMEATYKEARYNADTLMHPSRTCLVKPFDLYVMPRKQVQFEEYGKILRLTEQEERAKQSLLALQQSQRIALVQQQQAAVMAAASPTARPTTPPALTAAAAMAINPLLMLPPIPPPPQPLPSVTCTVRAEPPLIAKFPGRATTMPSIISLKDVTEAPFTLIFAAPSQQMAIPTPLISWLPPNEKVTWRCLEIFPVSGWCPSRDSLQVRFGGTTFSTSGDGTRLLAGKEAICGISISPTLIRLTFDDAANASLSAYLPSELPASVLGQQHSATSGSSGGDAALAAGAPSPSSAATKPGGMVTLLDTLGGGVDGPLSHGTSTTTSAGNAMMDAAASSSVEGTDALVLDGGVPLPTGAASTAATAKPPAAKKSKASGSGGASSSSAQAAAGKMGPTVSRVLSFLSSCVALQTTVKDAKDREMVPTNDRVVCVQIVDRFGLRDSSTSGLNGNATTYSAAGASATAASSSTPSNAPLAAGGGGGASFQPPLPASQGNQQYEVFQMLQRVVFLRSGEKMNYQ